MSAERERALELLDRTERDPAVSLDAMLKTLPDAPDGMYRSFLIRLAQGTYQYKPLLDACLNCFSKTPVKKMKPLIRSLMRMSVYQILFMDDVPDAAACNEAVRLAEKRGFHQLKGFVNGVLRSVVRGKEEITLPEKGTDAYLTVTCALPEAVSDHLKACYGRERAEAVAEAFLAPRPVMIRIRPERMRRDRVDTETLFERMKATAEGIEIKAHAHVPDMYALTHPGNPVRLYGFHEGYFTIQDPAGVRAVCAAGIKAGDTVIDVCASPGGKAAHAADLCGETGSVLARDVSEKKVKRMEETFTRLGLKQVRTQVFDALETDEALYETADVLICDLPCSALGITGRKPEVKYRFTTQDADALCDMQARIIDASWRYVKRGGTLLYSTCTLNPKENEEQVRRIFGSLPFRLRTMEQLFPGELDTDGFFYAVLERMS